MTRVRLGAVSYLNARPCVAGLDRESRFDLRFDLPARCAALLHEGGIDLGLVPSIEYLRGVSGPDAYCIVPDVAIASTGPVASVALYTQRPTSEIRSIALDTSSRTSVALTRVLCAHAWHIHPSFEPLGPDLEAMLARCDAALLIGDAALFVDHTRVVPKRDTTDDQRSHASAAPVQGDAAVATMVDTTVEKIDLGETWTSLTGLPFVYAFWAGPPGPLSGRDVRAIQAARDAGVADPDRIAREYLSDPAMQGVGARYLRDNIKYRLGEAEQAGLEMFYRYAAEIGLVPPPRGLRFF